MRIYKVCRGIVAVEYSGQDITQKMIIDGIAAGNIWGQNIAVCKPIQITEPKSAQTVSKPLCIAP